MKWKKLMSANGFEVSNYSKAIQNLVKEYEELDYQRKEIVNELKTAPQHHVEEIQSNLEDSQNFLNSLDAEICKKVEVYDRNRETYAKLGDKLKTSGRGRSGKSTTETKIEPIELPKDPEPTPQPNTQPAPEETKKKSASGGLLIVGVLALVGGIIGINLLRKK